MAKNRKQRRTGTKSGQKVSGGFTHADSKVTQLFAQGLQAIQAQDYARAEQLLSQVIQRDPKVAEVWCELGVMKVAQKQFAIAEKFFRSAIALKSDMAQAYNGLGVTMHHIGDTHRAIQAFEVCLKYNPDNMEAYRNITNAYNLIKDYHKAVSYSRDGLKRDPAHIDLQIQLGKALAQIHRAQEAVDIFEKILENPALSDTQRTLSMVNLSVAYLQNFQYADAVDYFETHYEENKTDIGFLNDYATALRGTFRYEEALAILNEALKTDPFYIYTYGNKGLIEHDIGHYAESINTNTKAIDIQADYVSTRYNLAYTYMLNEEYEKGWPYYECRWMPGGKAHVTQPYERPKWYAQDLNGKTLLIYLDQGIGDIIQMARYVPLLQKKYPDVKLKIEIEPKLISYFENVFEGDIEYIGCTFTDHRQVGDYDYHISFFGLPYCFKTTVEDVPLAQGYLRATNPKNYKDYDGQMVIGISWYTQNANPVLRRSIPIEKFKFLAQFRDVKFVDLQYGNREEDRKIAAAFGLDLYYDDSVDSWNDINAFMDQVAGCDMIVSIDNTTVHAAGAMGIPVWNILHYFPNFRWHLNNAASPWYNSMTLYRQEDINDYSKPLARIEADLKALINDGHKDLLAPPAYQPTYPLRGGENDTRPVAYYINDRESWGHWGYTASNMVIREAIEKAGYRLTNCRYQELVFTKMTPPKFESLDDDDYYALLWAKNPPLAEHLQNSDVIIMNLDTILVHHRDEGLKALYMAYIAHQRFGKPVHIIDNCGGLPKNADDKVRDIYARVISVCEPIVSRCDSLPLYIKDHGPKNVDKGNHVVLGGAPEFKANNPKAYHEVLKFLKRQGLNLHVLEGTKIAKSHDNKSFVELMGAIAANAYSVIDAKSEEEWLRDIASARLVVSGHLHHILAAQCYGVPYVALNGPSNSMAQFDTITDMNEPDLGLIETVLKSSPAPHLDKNYQDAQTTLIALEKVLSS